VDATARTRANLRRPEKVAALRTIRAYRTVSDDATFLLAGMPPVDLIAAENKGEGQNGATSSSGGKTTHEELHKKE